MVERLFLRSKFPSHQLSGRLAYKVHSCRKKKFSAYCKKLLLHVYYSLNDCTLGLDNLLITNHFQIKIWFQNRRNKCKRQLAVDTESSNLRTFSGVPLFMQSYMANLHSAEAAAAASTNPSSAGAGGVPHVPTSLAADSIGSSVLSHSHFLAAPTPTHPHPIYFPSSTTLTGIPNGLNPAFV